MPRRTSRSRKRLMGLRAQGLTVPALLLLPPPPASLGPEAAAAWRRFGEQAIAIRSIAAADLGVLELLAKTWETIGQLESLLIREGAVVISGSGAAKANPALAGVDRARNLAFRLLDALGLSPPGRQRIDLEPAPDDAAEERERVRQERIAGRYFHS